MKALTKEQRALYAQRRKENRKKDPFLSLNRKQRLFVKEYMATGNARRSWQKVYGSKEIEHASIRAYLFMKEHPEVMEWAYASAGLGPDSIIKTLTGALKATKHEFVRKEVVEVPDHWARMKAAEFLMKYTSVAGEKKEEVKGGGTNIVIVNDTKSGAFRVVEGTVEEAQIEE